VKLFTISQMTQIETGRFFILIVYGQDQQRSNATLCVEVGKWHGTLPAKNN